MKSIFCLLMFCLSACALDPKKDNNSDGKVLKLGINPVAQISEYAYDIDSETNVEIEAGGKEVRTSTKNSLGVRYKLRQDSLGNTLVEITYDKILVRTINADGETELNADNAPHSINQVEKLLGMLKGAKLTAVLNAKGETIELRGYKELGDKILASFAPNDTYGKETARKEWEGTFRQQLVDDNLNQLFKFFPDSLVDVGSQWTIHTQRNQPVNLNINNTYTLEEITNNVASIRVRGKIQSGNNSSIGGYSTTGDLSGKQSGKYDVDIASGLPIKSILESTTEGKIQTLGNEVPVRIENNVTIFQRK